MCFAEEKPQFVQDYLQKEVTEGRILGPFDPAYYPQIRTNHFGVIPKSTPGKWRLAYGGYVIARGE